MMIDSSSLITATVLPLFPERLDVKINTHITGYLLHAVVYDRGGSVTADVCLRKKTL